MRALLACIFVMLLPSASGNQCQSINEFPPRGFAAMNTFPMTAALTKQRFAVAETLFRNRTERFSGLSIIPVMQKYKKWFQEQAETSQCARDISDFLVAFQQKSIWAAEMFDSFGKIGSGIMQGNIYWTGDYRECLNVKPAVIVNDTFTRKFETQYCWALFTLHPPPGMLKSFDKGVWEVTTILNFTALYPLRVAVCVPDTCSELELDGMMDIFAEMLDMQNDERYVTFRGSYCVPKDNGLWTDKKAIPPIVICCVLATLLLIGTLYDMYLRFQTPRFEYSKLPNAEQYSINDHCNSIDKTELLHEEKAENDIGTTISLPQRNGVKSLPVVRNRKGILGQVMLSFSVYANATKILNLAGGNEAIPVINGIRFFSMTWVILGHTFMMGFANYENFAIFLDIRKTFVFHIIGNGIYSTDSFFFLGGMLTAYVFLTAHDARKGKVSWFLFYFHRYWRLTPAYFLYMYLINMTLSKYFSNGPFWPDNGFSGGCDDSWWRNLLYINNFGTVTEMCMGWTWYMANDMQLFWCSPILLIPMAKKKNVLTLLIAGILLVISSICIFILTLKYNLRVFIDFTEVELDLQNFINVFDQIYVKPYTRMQPYIIGMLLGWRLYLEKDKKVRLKARWVILGWTTATFLACSLMFGTFRAHMTQGVELFYHTLCKLTWSLSIAWVVYACKNGYGGIINSFLSWAPWNPLSRLTFMAYLFHYNALMFVYASVEKPLRFSFTGGFFYYIAMTICAYLGALIFSLAFESPFLAIEKIIFRS